MIGIFDLFLDDKQPNMDSDLDISTSNQAFSDPADMFIDVIALEPAVTWASPTDSLHTNSVSEPPIDCITQDTVTKGTEDIDSFNVVNENDADELISDMPSHEEQASHQIIDFNQDIADFTLQPLSGDDNLVSQSIFSDDGKYDSKNNLIVVGDVADDIQYVGEQTHSSCSLMAQEQFVHRYIGKAIPEDYLEWRAERWGVYSPEAGTNYEGQTMILDHFDIPYLRNNPADLADIDYAIDCDKDAIVAVDARYFYNDPTIPPGSGHAVAVVGKGVDPSTHETEGFYITDSNYPGTARFLDLVSFDRAWENDMISIPNPQKGSA